MKSVAISVLSGFALEALADAPFPRLTEGFLVGIAGRSGCCKTIGGREGVMIPVLTGDEVAAINGAALFLGAGRNQWIARNPNTINSAAAIAPIRYCER